MPGVLSFSPQSCINGKTEVLPQSNQSKHNLSCSDLFTKNVFVVTCRHVYLDGLKKQVFTAHSIILCFMFGPTGLLSHMFTNRFAERRKEAQLSSV